MSRGAAVTVFDTAEALGSYAADVVLARWEAALADRGVATLGCPAGRSPRTTYAALAARLRDRDLDGSRIHLVMMDDYIVHTAGAWRACPPEAHYSCARFAAIEVLGPLNASLRRPIPSANLHLPDPARPGAYEDAIRGLGGVDAFLLASGASDGHVAFNPPGTPLRARTRRIRLAVETRADNLGTFPDFKGLDEVPRHGVSVGPRTIVEHARSALMLLVGAGKREAARRILAADRYDPAWPATVVHECAGAEVLVDAAAAS